MNVTIYSTPTCGFCKQAKAFFDANNIAYTDIDVAANQAEAQKMIEKSGQMGVPVTVIEKDGKEDLVIGFNEPKFREILGL
jgi:glutaredoxin-like YruB-family protein